jgi:hypothetical protein
MAPQGAATTNYLLSDFYQIRIINRPMSSQPDLWVKVIIAGHGPTERVATFVNLNERYLMLWGGHNRTLHALAPLGFWLYSIVDVNWVFVALR